MGARVLEIAVQDVEGVRVAARVGAARVELCSALGATGGLTPSAGLLRAVLAAAGEVEVHPLVRPRPGGFVYSADELDVQVRDVRDAVAAGAHGVVVGVLRADGTVDEDALGLLVEAAQGREVTFHRAFDVVDDVAAALDVLARLGVARVLTSGGAATAPQGLDRLAATVARAAGRVQVMAGGGVRPDDVAALVATGVDAVHLSAKAVVSDAGGPGGGGDAGFEVTDETVAAAAAEALAHA
ncbi:copper homeostasis protein [Sediminihabitans luteus]|uniref:PF03932 family protein CutC n=1 Tax=Sediminihabitans luteus TaxID=1138585 RepID=A0A2M9D0L8_9CELL|nr:copper homeostasis protein CutC [Sediminihabitans luteus]PJJ77615.1 copper homeostasis protein [Sediminihabitans luteus]GII98515.1 copper homeostasis protein CutC [Sediminihabitans luteus]